MADKTAINEDGMDRTARDLTHAADEFKQAVDKLNAALDRDDGCWSDDQIGEGFNQKYRKDADAARKNLHNVADQMATMGNEGLPNIKNQLTQLDQAYGDSIKKMGDSIDKYGEQLDKQAEQDKQAGQS